MTIPPLVEAMAAPLVAMATTPPRVQATAVALAYVSSHPHEMYSSSLSQLADLDIHVRVVTSIQPLPVVEVSALVRASKPA